MAGQHRSSRRTRKREYIVARKARRVSSLLTNQLPMLELQQALKDPQQASPETVLQLQRLYGNQAISGLVQWAVIQRRYLDNPIIQWFTDTRVPKTTIKGKKIGTGKRGRRLRGVDTALRAYGNRGKSRPARLQDLQGAIDAWKQSKQGKSSQRRPRILDLEQEVNAKIAIFQPGNIVYRNPPLSEPEGRSILVQIEQQGNQEVLNGLEGDLPDYGAFEDFESPREHEWGLAKDRNNGEVYLIVGDKTGVSWGAYLPHVIAVAHSHPYFKDPHEPMGRRREMVGISTKEIATHAPLSHGIVRWSALADKSEGREMLKVFPSASDVAFAARQGLDQHTVYTPYAYTNTPEEQVGNPDSDIGNGPRLSFDIRNASQEGQSDIFSCTLVAKAGDREFWQQANVRADVSAGQLGTLDW